MTLLSKILAVARMTQRILFLFDLEYYDITVLLGVIHFAETQRLLTCTFLLIYFFHNSHMPTHTHNVL